MTNSESFSTNDFYRAGGSLPLGIPSYIKRKADDELYNGIKSGQFCYALAARQMGKSSLRLRVMDRLIAEGYVCISIDITKIGIENMSSDEWYYSVADIIRSDLVLDFDIGDWWEREKKESPVYRFYKFIKEIIIKQINKPIVFFIDEIDSMLSLDRKQFSTDDFFASIRAIYNERGDNHELTRINFVILGVASPTDLMNDASRTPFNIGKPIMLNNLKFDEAISLKDGLLELPYDSEELLKEVFYWTNGQPALTQQVCENLVHAGITALPLKIFVQKQIEIIFLNRSISENINLLNIQKRISENDKWSVRMLQIYETILNNGNCVEEPGDRAQIYLKLTGLVRLENDSLYLNNKIYESKLNNQWIKNLREIIIHPYNSVINGWVANNKSVKKCLSGKSLIEYEEWCKKREDLTHLENEFLTFSKTINERNKVLKKSYIFLILSIIFIAIISYLYLQVLLQPILKEINSSRNKIDSLTISKNNVEKSKESLTYTYNSLSKRSDSLETSIRSLGTNLAVVSDLLDLQRDSIKLLQTTQYYWTKINDSLKNLNSELKPKIEALEFYYNFLILEEWMEAFNNNERSIIKEEILSIDTCLRTDYVKAFKHLSYARTTKDKDANNAMFHISKANSILGNTEIFTNELYYISQNYIFYNDKYKFTKSIKTNGNSFENGDLEVGEVINDSLILIIGYEYNKPYIASYRVGLNLVQVCDYIKDTIIYNFTSPNMNYFINYRDAKVVLTWYSKKDFKRRPDQYYYFMQILDYKNNCLGQTINLNDILPELDTIPFFKYKICYQCKDDLTLYDAVDRDLFLTIDLKQNRIIRTLKKKEIDKEINRKDPGLKNNIFYDRFYLEENLNYFVYSFYRWNYEHRYIDSANIYVCDFQNNIIRLDKKRESRILNTHIIANDFEIQLLDSSVIICTTDSLYLEEYDLEGNLINIIYTSDENVIFYKRTDKIYFWKGYCLIENQLPLKMPLNYKNRRSINSKILWEMDNVIFSSNLDSIEIDFKEQIKKYVDPFRDEFEKNPYYKLLKPYQIQPERPILKSDIDESY